MRAGTSGGAASALMASALMCVIVMAALLLGSVDAAGSSYLVGACRLRSCDQASRSRLTRSLTHSLTHTHTHSLTHSLTLAHRHPLHSPYHFPIAHVPPVYSRSPLSTGAGKADITGPAADVNMMGYAMPQQIAKGIHIRQWARAFIVADAAQSTNRIVFVSIDACMGTQIMRMKVLRRVRTACVGGRSIS
jgi:hypothetical protein